MQSINSFVITSGLFTETENRLINIINDFINPA